MKTMSIEDIAAIDCEQLLKIQYAGTKVVRNVVEVLEKYGYHMKNDQRFVHQLKLLDEKHIKESIAFLESHGYTVTKNEES